MEFNKRFNRVYLLKEGMRDVHEHGSGLCLLVWSGKRGQGCNLATAHASPYCKKLDKLRGYYSDSLKLVQCASVQGLKIKTCRCKKLHGFDLMGFMLVNIDPSVRRSLPTSWWSAKRLESEDEEDL